ncbi:hypothetical protein HY572_04000 [Candidatus Micrarchaeota archaeon]|nr:hypothetical protein [Candidatus Micrarchaeota archaeon]
MKRVLVLSLFVLLGVVAFSYLASTKSALTETQAVDVVLEDVKPLESQGVMARVVDSRFENGKWAVDVLLTRRAHTKCPSVEKRFYSLLPIGFRSESVVASCNPPVAISYREEALIRSAKDAGAFSEGYGCAFYWADFDAATSASYCASPESSAVQAFGSGLPQNTWVVSWTWNNATAFFAYSPSDAFLKSS